MIYRVVRNLEFSGCGPAAAYPPDVVKIHWHGEIRAFRVYPSGKVDGLEQFPLGDHTLQPEVPASLTILQHLHPEALTNYVTIKFDSACEVRSLFCWLLNPTTNTRLVLHSFSSEGKVLYTLPEEIEYNLAVYRTLHPCVHELLLKVKDSQVRPANMDAYVAWAKARV